MIHTESVCYIDNAGKLEALKNPQGGPMKFFVSAPDLDLVRTLLRETTFLPMPLLFITRQTTGPQPAPLTNDFQI